jgi:hypothetical protein
MAFVPTPFARSLTGHMCAWRAGWDGVRHPLFDRWEDGLHPAFREAGIAAVRDDEVRLHGFARAVTSSQMFALNLFLPFRAGPREALAARLGARLGVALVIERVQFEWVPPGALLGELDGDRPAGDEPATGVDVVLWARTSDGAPAVVLVEVKLGEGGFTACAGRESRGNRRPDVCASAATFFADPSACYLRRPVRKRRDRRYWEIFANAYGSVADAFPGADRTGGCPFAGDLQQPMRNLALARALEEAGVVTRAWYGLCPHDQNPDVRPHWAAWAGVLPPGVPAPVFPASDVLAAGCDAGHTDWAAWMAARYRLPLPEPR